MAGYYDELLEEIDELIDEGRSDEALFTIEKELRMPYVPADVEKRIRQIRNDLRAEKRAKEEGKEVSLDTLLKQLRGDEVSQLKAASQLGSRNLRECTEEIRRYLASDPCEEAAALIIEAIAEQELREEFVYNRSGVSYEFYGDSVIPCTQSNGFRHALSLLEKWRGNDNPSLLAMCRTLLIREVYMFLPLSYEKEEGQELALQILENVSELNDEGQTYREVLANFGMSHLLNLKS